jgi:hypothetical protein
MPSSSATLALVLFTLAGVIVSTAVLVGGWERSLTASAALPSESLPAGCTRPAGGFLIIMSEYGYNDSVLEGAGPAKAWPVITVAQASVVNITVCNVDTSQAHGFQISNYYDSEIVSVDPGQILKVSFVATKEGTFTIYCAIFCSIHLFMEYGQLRVTG